MFDLLTAVFVFFLIVGVAITPRVVVANSPVYLNTNTFNLLVKCIPYEANFNYLWEKRNDDLPARAKGIQSPYMTIVNLTPEDSGEYRCIMSNSTGKIFSDFTELIAKGILHCICLQILPTEI